MFDIISQKDPNYLEKLFQDEQIMAQANKEDDLREIIRQKAERHHRYYVKLTASNLDTNTSSNSCREMANDVPMVEKIQIKHAVAANADVNKHNESGASISHQFTGSEGSTVVKRQRRQGVYEFTSSTTSDEDTIFKSVKTLRENYLAMLEKTVKDLQLHGSEVKLAEDTKDTHNENKDVDSLLLPPTSGYCSSSASGASDDEREKNWYRKKSVERCGSTDSAMGQSDEEITINSNWGEKKEEIDEDEIIRSYPVSPYSPRGSVDHVNVPSKTIIEAQYVPYPVDRKFSDCVSDSVDFVNDSRRQSCFTDDGDEQSRYRYWRTPSVVVSDYSDDIMGLSLEDIEYIRNRKENSSSPDSSLHSSCSNLNYCGSTISGLDTEYVLTKPYRKSSDCSTCSTLSGDEDSDGLQPKKKEVSFCIF